MDELLSRAGNQAVSFAIRSGISLVSGYAIRSLTRFLDKLPDDERHGLDEIKRRLNTKIKIVTPAIDLIQLIAARGNTSLDSTVLLTRSLRREINEFDNRVEEASEKMQNARTVDERKRAAKAVEQYMTGLLARIEESIPLISLALTTSGANLSASLPDTVSPSRLLQASAFLLAADSANLHQPDRRYRVGPPFTLKLYTVFYGTARNPHTTTAGDITWKEEHAKCIVEVFRVPADKPVEKHRYSPETVYSYELVVTEDLNDGRYHEELDAPSAPAEDENGTIRGKSRVIPLSIITRLFFSASGRLLKIEDAISPVLVVKLNKAFLDRSPYAVFEDELSLSEEDSDEAEEETLAARVESPTNIEWLAFELYDDGDEDDDGSIKDEDSEEDDEQEQDSKQRGRFSEASLVAAFSRISLSSSDIETMIAARRKSTRPTSDQPMTATVNSLSLLEYIIRLAALQTNDQASMLTISDERIALYLRDENRNVAREGARDLSDPIGPAPSPVMATRFADSGTRQRRSRSSTPITPSNDTAASVRDGSSLRRSTRIEHKSPAQAHVSARKPVRNPNAQESPKTPMISSVVRSNEPGTLTPWELDRLRSYNEPSPLDGKVTRRRRSGSKLP